MPLSDELRVRRRSARAAVVGLIGAGLIASGVAGQALASGSLCIRTDPGNENPGPACGPYRYEPISDSDRDNTYVLNDMWNPFGPGHPQTIRVHTPGRWSVVSDQARGNTAVLSYPDVQQIVTTRVLLALATKLPDSPLRIPTSVTFAHLERPIDAGNHPDRDPRTSGPEGGQK